MIMLKRVALLLLVGIACVVVFELGARLPIPGAERLSILGIESFVPTAEARVGRPLTPVSVAGTARRTSRRVDRRY
jgi:hypothetical protein